MRVQISVLFLFLGLVPVLVLTQQDNALQDVVATALLAEITLEGEQGGSKRPETHREPGSSARSGTVQSQEEIFTYDYYSLRNAYDISRL
ncbi:pre T-cell antigen receptor alpha [Platysternon megacephalum]|nr:pre T-cell antigen receptor alpha [Platysternon megacephalum]